MNVKGPFAGLCAFCGEKFRLGQPGDIEHFRPKAKVDDWPSGQRVRIVENEAEKNHPGYYWLSYDWQNLLPACWSCNRPTTDVVSGAALGKRNYFPVRGRRAFRPGEEQDEQKLLVHPCLDEPTDHLKFDPATGVLIPLDERGDATEKIFNLNDRDLPGERKQAYENTKARYPGIVHSASKFGPETITQEDIEFLKKCHEGRERYPIATKTAIDHARRGDASVGSIFD